MTEKERHDLFLSVFDKIISKEFDEFLFENGFFRAPASTKYHGAYEGGLFDHSFLTMDILVDLSANNQLKWGRAESPFIVGMFHDICKLDNYVFNEETNKFEYNQNTLIKGHGEKSVMLLSQLMTLTEEEIVCILYHMGAFTEKDKWSDYTRAVHKYPNVLWTHQADMIASHVVGV